MPDKFLEELENDELLSNDNETQMYEHHRFVVDKGQSAMRVDKYLSMHIVGISRSRIQQGADAGCVLVNDAPVKSNYKIKPNDVVTMVLDYPKNEFELVPQDLPLDIVYEDDDIMIINKAAGMVVHPGFGNFEGTVANAVAFRLQNSADYNPDDPRPGIVHRIDKDTSGLMIVAKTEQAKINLAEQFFNKTIDRKYVALAWGHVDEDEGIIENYIGRNLKNRLQMAIFDNEEEGKHALTRYKVLERIGYVTLVECQLETGRTHQIRVHMKHIGHTLFNDERYGGNEILRGQNFSKYKQFVQNCFKICPRQALHAQQLGFTHPRTGEKMIFETPLPTDMQQILERWRNYISNIEGKI